MKLKLFTIYDSKAETYSNPFYSQTTGTGIRMFERTVNDSSTQIHEYPHDFTLFEIGEWNDNDGIIEMYEIKRSLGLALEFKNDSLSTV